MELARFVYNFIPAQTVLERLLGLPSHGLAIEEQLGLVA